MTAQVAADLRAAADVLERDGWTQGLQHSRCGHCAAGAIEVAVDPNWSSDEAWDWAICDRFEEATSELAQLIGARIESWNDAHDRTADEVIAALRAAADRAEAAA